MLRNYFKIALRNLWHSKAFTTINLAGLTIGTACCLYMLLYVRSQYGYDQQHTAANDIYRVSTQVIEPGGGPQRLAPSSPPIAAALLNDFAEVIAVTRLFKSPSEKPSLLKAGNDFVYERKGYYVDSSFFQLFNYHFLEGSPQHALYEPFTVVLSSTTARKLFGDKSALNQPLMIDSDLYRVTGVYDETVAKSHIRANFLMSFRAGGMIEYLRTSEQWVGQNLVHTYIRLQPGSNPDQLQAKLPAFLQRHGQQQLAQVKIKKDLFLQHVTDIHLKPQLDSELEKNASPEFIKLMLIIAGLIQLMACINFMNMNTARSTGRAREVGVRKVMGASRPSLVGRFLGESVLLAAVSVVLAVPVVCILLPTLNNLLQAELPVTFNNLNDISFILLALVIATGLLAGSYPAFYLTAYRAVNVLKGNLHNQYTSVSLRKGLVVTQFVVSITLLIAIIVITRQLQSFKTRDLGFDKQQKIIVPFNTSEAQSRMVAFNNELHSNPSVKQTGSAAYYPSNWAGENMPMFYQGPGSKEKTGAGVWANRINETFLETLHIPILAGRNLTKADTNRQIVINEETLLRLSIPIQKAIGARLSLEYQEVHEDYTIIGVVKDFNIRSLKEPLRPLMLLGARSEKLNYLIVDVQGGSFSALVEQMADTWHKLIPGVPFTYSFLDADIEQQYKAENALLEIMNGAAIVAFLIAGLGLFGLAMFTAEQRTKEIGVRKVLGASVGSIVGLLSGEFLKLVAVAILIASPLAWYAMKQWLEDFAYKIEMEWWIFALAGLSAIAIALLTVSFQSVKAALMNPVKSLRSE